MDTTGNERAGRELELWRALDRLSVGSRGWGFRVYSAGFTAACVSGAAVLTGGYFLGTEWAGPWAVFIPVAVGLLAAALVYAVERWRTKRRLDFLHSALVEVGADPERPTGRGLGAYYDPQLILLRTQYEAVRVEGREEAALFEENFGFTPHDGFETGPLNVTPGGQRLARLRDRWETQLELRQVAGTGAVTPISFRRAVERQLYPKEMSVPVELTIRKAYLETSWQLIRNRYGWDTAAWEDSLPGFIYRRAVRDTRELDSLTRKPPR